MPLHNHRAKSENLLALGSKLDANSWSGLKAKCQYRPRLLADVPALKEAYLLLQSCGIFHRINPCLGVFQTLKLVSAMVR
jgi:hypothetical protein